MTTSGSQWRYDTAMKIAPFETEHFFARYEFNTPHQLCNSDCESISIAELLSLAGDSLQQFGNERLAYTESQGRSELRRAIANTYSKVKMDDVIVLGTPVEGIYLAARALLEPGDEVIVLSPAYDALITLFEHIAGKSQVKRWSFKTAADSWELDLDELRGLISSRTKLLVVNFPHNPTGYLPGPEFQQALMDLVEEHELYVFSDEMYFGLVQPGTEAIPSAADLSKRAVVLSGLSKTYGLPGLRCGWLVVQDRDLHEQIMNWKFYTSICPPGPVEYLSIAALSVRDTLRDRNIARIKHNLDVADAFFGRWSDQFTWKRPVAGSTALIAWDVPSVAAISHELAINEGILIQSARMLGGDDKHMRFGFGRDNFPEALSCFENWLRRDSLPG
jgi:aspartate/methionine/tyrosine aminotransferase